MAEHRAAGASRTTLTSSKSYAERRPLPDVADCEPLQPTYSRRSAARAGMIECRPGTIVEVALEPAESPALRPNGLRNKV
jgi:hypothetical protein